MVSSNEKDGDEDDDKTYKSFEELDDCFHIDDEEADECRYCNPAYSANLDQVRMRSGS